MPNFNIALPALIASVFLHVLLVFVFALIYLPQAFDGRNVIESYLPDDGEIEAAELFFDDTGHEGAINFVTEIPDSAVQEQTVFEPLTDLGFRKQSETLSTIGEAASYANLAATSESAAGGFSGRTNKGTLLVKGGGNDASERAVALALAWFERVQFPDGSWNYDHRLNPAFATKALDPARDVRLRNARMSATAMAILPYLGNGYTHRDTSKYKNVIRDGLNYIKKNAVRTDVGISFCEPLAKSAEMYHQGIVTIAVCEAAAMTRDRELEALAQGGIKYICWAQNEQGGWRYLPHQAGDTSGFGWAFMALKSGQMAHLSIPQTTIQKAKNFLDAVVSVDGGTRYGYTDKKESTEGYEGTTAIGLLSQMYIGCKPDDAALQGGVEYLTKSGPDPLRLYYGYYATQVLHHLGGERWQKWNAVMRDALIESQVQTGIETGTWFTEKDHLPNGGRLCCTSLATMILEVYYRHLPLYKETTSRAEFPLD
ncbi:MAG: hypothetical protein LBU65_04020 [Planctomycetaceae bacterium]|jgi:hypothetical protein|nr:hypothetical protein [Planctomycetaceae bacterium]